MGASPERRPASVLLKPRYSLQALSWSSAQASGSLALGSTAWMLSGLTASPLFNGLLPTLVALVTLLPLRARTRLGVLLQLLALLLLLGVAVRIKPGAGMPEALLTLLAVVVWIVGQQLSLNAVRRQMLLALGVPLRWLRWGTETGQLLGHVLTGVLFPLGRALAQFAVALVLLLPLLPPIPDDHHEGALIAREAGVEPAPSGAAVGGIRLEQRLLLQGLLFGGLFALLPLWVREQGRGSCFDFGMLLTAFAVGRLGAAALSERIWPLHAPSRSILALQYGCLALMLVLSQWLPGWGAVVLFLPFGMLAGLIDHGLLMDSPCRDGGLPDLDGFERTLVLGGLIGSLLMGLLSQRLGLAWALPLQVLAFALAALPWPLRQPLARRS
jgi:hypothetical protein